MLEMSDISGKMLCWFGFTFGSNFSFLSLKLIIKQTKENKTLSTPVAGDDKQANEERNCVGCVAAG